MNVFQFFIDDNLFNFAYKENQFIWLPKTWYSEQGFGSSTLIRLWYDYPIQTIIKLLFSLHLPWSFIDKLLWLLPFIIGLFSSQYLGKILQFSTKNKLLLILIYLTNTYFLMLFGGGQLGVALAFSLFPSIIGVFLNSVKNFNKIRIINVLINGGILALLTAFDLRFTYIFMCVNILYVGFFLLFQKKKNSVSLYTLQILLKDIILPVTVAGMLHMFWILPIIIFGGISNLGNEYTGIGMLHYLSFGDFTHSISILHPNWPENLFGRVYFMKPEFLILPILSFTSLLFIQNERVGNRKTIFSFFIIIGLVGAFLAKGTNEPFGWIYSWLFTHVPGFIMFRDPTKFYLLTILSYSVLIPYSIEQISIYIETKFQWKKYPFIILIVVFGIFWLFSVRQLFTGELTGNFKPQAIPSEYTQWAQSVSSSTNFSRTLWVPIPEKFSYADDIHPVVSIEALFGSNSIEGFLKEIHKPDFIEILANASISHIAVPIDFERKIFLDNYMYNEKIRDRIIQGLDELGLNVTTIGRLRIYSVPHYLPLISTIQNKQITYTYDREAMSYTFTVPESKIQSEVLFRMSYDPGWNVQVNNNSYKPEKYGKFMLFKIPVGINGNIMLSYTPQYYAKIGAYISLFVLYVIVILYLIFRKKESAIHG